MATVILFYIFLFSMKDFLLWEWCIIEWMTQAYSEKGNLSADLKRELNLRPSDY